MPYVLRSSTGYVRSFEPLSLGSKRQAQWFDPARTDLRATLARALALGLTNVRLVAGGDADRPPSAVPRD